MADYDDTNSGVLFSNDKKSEKAPDWTGKFNYNGEEFKLAGWVRISNNTGKEFISLKVDTYEPESKGKESDSWKQARERFKKDEEPLEQQSEINLDDIPF